MSIEIEQQVTTVEVISEMETATEVVVEVSLSEVVTEHVQMIIEGGIGPAGQGAYQLAVAKGFIGTEEQWLESIGGEPAYLGKELVREGGKLVEVRLYNDAERTQLGKTLRLVRTGSVLTSVEVRDGTGAVRQRKLLERDGQGLLVAVGYSNS